jgi:hypothetical protein
VPGTSKKPPQVNQFLGGGFNVGVDDIEHADGDYVTQK